MTSIRTKTRTHRSYCSVALAAACVLPLSACADDPIGTSERGVDAPPAETSVDSVFLVPRHVPGSCELQVGDTADLRFTATNIRATETERLLAISIPAAQEVRITPPPPLEIAPKQTIAVEAGVPGSIPLSVVATGLPEAARPGTSVDVDFRFELTGDLRMRVPIEACPTQQ